MSDGREVEADLRRLYLHLFHGGTLQGVADAERISAGIAEIERLRAKVSDSTKAEIEREFDRVRFMLEESDLTIDRFRDHAIELKRRLDDATKEIGKLKTEFAAYREGTTQELLRMTAEVDAEGYYHRCQQLEAEIGRLKTCCEPNRRLG